MSRALIAGPRGGERGRKTLRIYERGIAKRIPSLPTDRAVPLRVCITERATTETEISEIIIQFFARIQFSPRNAKPQTRITRVAPFPCILFILPTPSLFLRFSPVPSRLSSFLTSTDAKRGIMCSERDFHGQWGILLETRRDIRGNCCDQRRRSFPRVRARQNAEGWRALAKTKRDTAARLRYAMIIVAIRIRSIARRKEPRSSEETV